MNLLHYAILTIVVLVFLCKLSYHVFYEIPHDRKIIEQRDSHELESPLISPTR